MRETTIGALPVSWIPVLLLPFLLMVPAGVGFADETKDGDQVFAGLTVVETEALAELRGGDTTTNVQSSQKLSAKVIDSATNAHTITNGAVTIGAHAFDSFRGIGLVLNNSGNGNAIEAALSVSFYLQ